MAMDLMNHTKKNGLSTAAGKYGHFVDEIQEALVENKKALVKLKKATEDTLFEGNRKVKKNPWAYIGAAAGCGILLGLILGKRQ